MRSVLYKFIWFVLGTALLWSYPGVVLYSMCTAHNLWPRDYRIPTLTFSLFKITFRILLGTYMIFFIVFPSKYFDSFGLSAASFKASSSVHASSTSIVPLVFPLICTGSVIVASFRYAGLACYWDTRTPYLVKNQSYFFMQYRASKRSGFFLYKLKFTFYI